MSCTMRAKNLHNKEVGTVEGVPTDFILRLQRSFVKMGAVQCGFCLQGVTTQLYNLLEHIPCPTEEDIRKVLTMHSCRCMAPNILVEATKAFIENMEIGDGRSAPKISHHRTKTCPDALYPSRLKGRSTYHWSVVLSEGIWHESVEFIWRKDHVSNPIRLIAFLLPLSPEKRGLG